MKILLIDCGPDSDGESLMVTTINGALSEIGSTVVRMNPVAVPLITSGFAWAAILAGTLVEVLVHE